MKTLEVSADLNSLSAVQEFVMQALDESDRSEELVQDIRLVLEEIFTNIVFYAYPGRAGFVVVSVFEGPDHVFRVRFTDWGKAFNPMEYEVSDLDQDFDRREIGGLGIHLVRQLTHDIHYSREGPCNVLTLSFLIPRLRGTPQDPQRKEPEPCH